MASYQIKSEQTNYNILNDGSQRKGDRVQVLPAAGHSPFVLTVLISPPLTGGTLSQVKIAGRNNLWISVAQDAAGQYLVWSDKAYTWTAARTAQGDYEFFVPGKDLYWVSNKKNGKYLTLQPGAKTVEKEILFIVTRFGRLDEDQEEDKAV